MSDADTSDDDAASMVPAEQFRELILGFQRLRTTDIGLFNLFDWTNISRDIINALFPVNVGRYGRLDHPVAYLKSTALVEQWRLRSGINQRDKIESLEQEAERIRSIQMSSFLETKRNFAMGNKPML